MAQSSMLHIRVDDTIKHQATEILASFGMSVSDAVRLFLQRVIAEQAFPLELKVPNAQTVAAMEEARQLMAEKSLAFSDAQAMFDELDQKH